MSEPNELTGERLLKFIKEQSQRKRMAPLDGFLEFLRGIWMDNTEEEARQQWLVKVKHYPWYADDSLYCLNWVIENRPENLLELLEEHGWISLFHEPDEAGNEASYSYDETLEWLKGMRDRFQKVYDQG